MKKIILSAFVALAFLTTSCSSDDDNSSSMPQESPCQTCTSDFGPIQFCQNDDGSIVTVSPEGQENIIDTKGLSFAQFIAGIVDNGETCAASSKQIDNSIDDNCRLCNASGGSEVEICDIGEGKYTISIAGSVPDERLLADINAETFENVIDYFKAEYDYTCPLN